MLKRILLVVLALSIALSCVSFSEEPSIDNDYEMMAQVALGAAITEGKLAQSQAENWFWRITAAVLLSIAASNANK